MKLIILIISITIILSSSLISQNLKIYTSQPNESEIFTLKKSQINILDSLKKNYCNFGNYGVVLHNNKLYDFVDLKKNNNGEHSRRLSYIDIEKNKFHLYNNKLYCWDVTRSHFCIFNNYLFYITYNEINKHKGYCYIYKFNKENDKECLEIVLNKQDYTRLAYQNSTPLIWEENENLKLKIISYKYQFNYLWLFFFWAPRGAPEKWIWDEKSKKEYIYTFDKNLNLISIKEVSIGKDND